jgi:hypothetical protein
MSEIVISISEAEYQMHRNDYDGICLSCGEWTSGDCEPDAREYRCGFCDKDTVYGCEEALVMLRIEIV